MHHHVPGRRTPTRPRVNRGVSRERLTRSSLRVGSPLRRTLEDELTPPTINPALVQLTHPGQTVQPPTNVELISPRGIDFRRPLPLDDEEEEERSLGLLELSDDTLSESRSYFDPAVFEEFGLTTSSERGDENASGLNEHDFSEFLRDSCSPEPSETDVADDEEGSDVVEGDQEGEDSDNEPETTRNSVTVLERSLFSTPQNTNPRRRTRYQDAKDRCDLCAIGFSRKSNYLNHMRMKHAPGQKKLFPCEFCVAQGLKNAKGGPMVFSRKPDLTRHVLATHTSGIRCPDCPLSFKARGDGLYHHLQTHGHDETIARNLANFLYKRHKQKIGNGLREVMTRADAAPQPTTSGQPNSSQRVNSYRGHTLPSAALLHRNQSHRPNPSVAHVQNVTDANGNRSEPEAMDEDS